MHASVVSGPGGPAGRWNTPRTLHRESHIRMAYRFQSGQSISENVQRIVSEEVKAAIKQLGRSQLKQREKAIHEARKGVKKLRGLLKLLRPHLGDDYRKSDRMLRDIGRGLSELRDADAIIKTFDDVVQEEGHDWEPEVAAEIRKGLQAMKRARERAKDPEAVMWLAKAELITFGEAAADWTLDAVGFEALQAGLRATYREGRRTMEAAAKSKRSQPYHDWRKRVKDHWYQVRLLNDLWTTKAELREEQLHELETDLGEDHNLVVLGSHVKSQPENFGGEQAVCLFTAAAKHKQKELRHKALKLGEELYGDKPKRFVRMLARTWPTASEEGMNGKRRSSASSR